MLKKEPSDRSDLIESCLRSFIRSGTLDVSLDQLASEVGVSKRMLVHYISGRETIEERALTLLENRLREQFAPENFPAGIAARTVLDALWDKTTNPQSKGVLLLVMDLSRRAWNGSERAKSFCREQQRLWVELLLRYLPDKNTAEDVLQSFQGAIPAYLITGDPEPGRLMLRRFCARPETRRKSNTTAMPHRRLNGCHNPFGSIDANYAPQRAQNAETAIDIVRGLHDIHTYLLPAAGRLCMLLGFGTAAGGATA